jgi:hypothetical protein
MDTKGARHLSVRLAVGAAQGERVEVVSVADGGASVVPGDLGTVVSIEEGMARVLFDSGAELDVDPLLVQLRPLLRRSA